MKFPRKTFSALKEPQRQKGKEMGKVERKWTTKKIQNCCLSLAAENNLSDLYHPGCVYGKAQDEDTCVLRIKSSSTVNWWCSSQCRGQVHERPRPATVFRVSTGLPVYRRDAGCKGQSGSLEQHVHAVTGASQPRCYQTPKVNRLLLRTT
ncbi:uncharacterized protein FN964_012370 isoform 1-T1 [Alca torda]